MQIGSTEALKAQMEKCIDSDCKDCPYTDEEICDTAMTKDTLEYIESLEERIAIKDEALEALEKRCNALNALEQRCNALEKRNEPIKNSVYNEQKYGDHLAHCPSCEKALPMISQYGKSNYCYHCGQAVKWE